MINYLNKNNQTVTKKSYVYSAGNEPTWYEYLDDDSGFDGYIKSLLISKDFPIPDFNISNSGGPSSGVSNMSSLGSESFDAAFENFMASPDQPDRWSTRDWLMMAPGPEYSVSKFLREA